MDRTKIILTFVGLVVAAVGGVIAVLTFLGYAEDDSPEGKVAACREEHNVAGLASSAATQAIEDDQGVPQAKLWANCTLPVLPGAGEDGYWEIYVTRYWTGTATADLQNADVFSSACKNVVVRFNHVQRGTVRTWDSELAMDQVREINASFDDPTFELSSLTPQMEDVTGGHQAGDLILLTPANIRLTDVKCVE